MVAQLLTKYEQQQKLIEQLSVESRCVSDPRLFFYSGVLKSKNGSHKTADKFHEKYASCVFCGREDNLTMAHLICELDPVTKDIINFSFFGKPTYRDDIDTKSPRNFLRLCGTKGEQGTCHDLFDCFKLSLIYDQFNKDYVIFSIDKNHNLNNKRIRLDEEFPPYRRLLCWRFKRALVLYACVLGPEAPKICDAIDFSETASTACKDDVFEDEDESTSEFKSSV
jgi:hypothetical protein